MDKNFFNIWKIGLSFGITWGLYVLFFAWSAGFLNGWGQGVVETLGSFYLGYTATFLGGIIGFIWGFFCAGVFGVIASWIYNKIA